MFVIFWCGCAFLRHIFLKLFYWIEALIKLENSISLDCKTVVFGRFRKARGAVSAILACETREPHTPVFSVCPHSPSPFLHSLQTFRSNIDRLSRSQKIRLFCSLQFLWVLNFSSVVYGVMFMHTQYYYFKLFCFSHTHLFLAIN